ncbi:MAG: hypothetical protein O2960_28500, partial [Verrucomicrobia bacterium]|nr:hypothetical protein [Verrucomicrobiota bacterium]
VQPLRYGLELMGDIGFGERRFRCHSSPPTLAGTGNRVAHVHRRITVIVRIDGPLGGVEDMGSGRKRITIRTMEGADWLEYVLRTDSEGIITNATKRVYDPSK